MASKAVRKMLGDWREPYAEQLMVLIPTQSKSTIARWCVDYAEKHFLPIWQEAVPNDGRPAAALDAARRWLNGEIKLPEAKPIILDAHQAAREQEGNHAAQAACRACGQAASVIHAASHSLAILFYGSAAVAYSTVGIGQDPEVYERIAAEEGWRQLEALKAVAVPDEPRPAKINWRC